MRLELRNDHIVGYWISGVYFRKYKRPYNLINKWKRTIKRINHAVVRTNSEIEVIREFEYAYSGQEDQKIAKLHALNVVHIKDSDQHRLLIIQMKNQIKFYNHADKMFKSGVVNDDYKN